jgi:alkanesulfonate monooxygenase SsuD/methylene tetrahydromethanopterin reductase-like flavin-dependent oxidoreductase (luciferase family)
VGTRFLPDEDVAARHAAIDEAARAAGRDPGDIVRAANVMGLGATPGDRLARVAELGFSVLLAGVPDEDPVGFVRRLGEDVAPRLRERV